MLLWPFNKYPGTDYETFNWEWVIKIVKRWESIDTIVKNYMDRAETAATNSENSAEQSATSAQNAHEDVQIANGLIGQAQTTLDNATTSINAFEERIEGAAWAAGGSLAYGRIDASLIYTSANANQCQGLACDGNNRIFYASNSPNVSITTLTIQNGTVSASVHNETDARIGHANDMTYYPTDDRLVICPWKDGNGSRYDVVIFDASNMNYIQSITLDNSQIGPGTYVPFGIAFDRNKSVYYVRYHDYIATYDLSFQYLDCVHLNDYDYDTTTQGMETDGNFWYLVFHNKIMVYDFGGNLCHELRYPTEVENLAYNWKYHFYMNRVDATLTKIYSANIYRAWLQPYSTTYPYPVGIAPNGQTIYRLCATFDGSVLTANTETAIFNAGSQPISGYHPDRMIDYGITLRNPNNNIMFKLPGAASDFTTHVRLDYDSLRIFLKSTNDRSAFTEGFVWCDFTLRPV